MVFTKSRGWVIISCMANGIDSVGNGSALSFICIRYLMVAIQWRSVNSNI